MFDDMTTSDRYFRKINLFSEPTDNTRKRGQLMR
jgi:hypothetical protein